MRLKKQIFITIPTSSYGILPALIYDASYFNRPTVWKCKDKPAQTWYNSPWEVKS